MMSNLNKLVQHYFYNQDTNTFFSYTITEEQQKRMKVDNEFAKSVYEEIKIERRNNQYENSGCSSSGKYINDVSIDNSLPATTTCTKNDFVIPSEILEPFNNMPTECTTSDQHIDLTCDEEYEANFLPLCSAKNTKCTNTIILY